MRRFIAIVSGLFCLSLTTGCALFGGIDSQFIIQDAQVEEIEILILESFPVQVHVVARGILSDGCTEVGEIQQNRNGQLFEIQITTRRPKDAFCIQVLGEFETTIRLDVYGLEAGVYAVNVNGVEETFELAVDNSPP